LIAACPEATNLLQSTEWPSCLAGKTIAGTEPFNNQACELRINADGSFEYARSGAVAIKTPAKSTWKGSTGTYQNDRKSIFLAGIAPDFTAAAGESRITAVNLSFFFGIQKDDDVEIEYLDAALNRQVYNCKVNVE